MIKIIYEQPAQVEENVFESELTPLQKGLKNLKKAKTSNLDKWGKDPDHNVYYITGYSGSGKSTTALSIIKDGDSVIHLDAYSEPESDEFNEIKNNKFTSYLNRNVPDWQLMSNATKDGTNGTIKKYSIEYWDIVEQFRKAIESYGVQEYNLGRRVVVEGVQIADGWLAENKDYYKDKPIIILGTSVLQSMNRASRRDREQNAVSGLLNMSKDNAKEYIQRYAGSNNRLNDLSKQSSAKKDKRYIKKYIDNNFQ